jgi:anaerobic magnesium-protoporphyrin IX monomethyl ester cyclase
MNPMNNAISRLAGKRRIKVLFVRPPHHYWPIINQSDNFLIPLNYPTLAGWIREKLDFIDVEILDCCVSEIGYGSLPEELRRRAPDVVAIGEKVVYAHDALRAFRIARETLPECVTLAGGHIFTHEPEWALKTCPELDYVIRFEGEIAMEHFLRTAHEGGTEEDCLSLCWLDDKDGPMRFTKLAPAVANLDDIPPAAFDLMPVQKYSPFGMLWPQAATIQRGRGCVDTCAFCSWIAMENKHTMTDGGIVNSESWYRSKSVEKVLEEVDILYHRYGVRYLFWVDATWNVNDKWLNTFCDEIIRRGYDLGWWAFTRYDLLPRQHKNGTLKKMVQAGLRHVLVGVERQEEGLEFLNKHRYSEDGAVKAFHILRDHYPEVFRQGTFITGIRSDNAESIRALLAHAHACDLDFAAFHPCTPFPGTPVYEQAKANGWMEETNFSNYDMFYPIMETEHLTREEVAHWTTWCQQNFVQRKPLRYASRLFSKHSVRRRLHWWFLLAIGRVMANQAVNHLKGAEDFQGFAGVNKLWKPKWYDS